MYELSCERTSWKSQARNHYFMCGGGGAKVDQTTEMYFLFNSF